ncbi:MAG: hypothetical protein KME27_31335 [Lyngbya sp. HA4199-MV5]|nr:hypothetical protein [Lyngbya sp. HA4199-MV5]
MTEANASVIEAAVLEPFREYERNLGEFTEALQEALNAENGKLSAETRNELKRLQTVLKLRDEDVELISDRIGVSLDGSPAVEHLLEELTRLVEEQIPSEPIQDHSEDSDTRGFATTSPSLKTPRIYTMYTSAYRSSARRKSACRAIKRHSKCELGSPDAQTSSVETLQQQTNGNPLGSKWHKPLLWLGVGTLGSSILLGIWVLHDQWLPQKTQTSIPESASSTINTSEDLKQVTTNVVAALATERLNQDNVEAAQPAIEALLDRGAFAQATAVLTPVLESRKDNPIINFLIGRLIWQSIKAGNKDYSLDDTRGYWQTAVKQNKQKTSTEYLNAPSFVYDYDSIEYQNALGFAYYATGDLNTASQAWFQAL